jgi:pyruvate dehydrogenase E1 component
MAFVRMLTKLLKTRHGQADRAHRARRGAHLRHGSPVPQCGIYSHVGQLYEPVDKESLLYYKEAKDGQILEEGINEAGSMSSFIAAGTAYANHGVNTIPFYIYYSMFGFQRVGDLAWAAGDMRCRGFLLGGTAGRTTLNGEGLQHQDGHSHLLAYPVPNLMCYDPAYAYEIGVIIQEGIRRMYDQQESIFYYLTLGNENYAMPAMPEGAREGILKGMYLLKKSDQGRQGPRAAAGQRRDPQRGGQGPGHPGREVWCSRGCLVGHQLQGTARDGMEVDRWNLLHPDQKPQVPYVTQMLAGTEGPVVAASDYVKMLPDAIARWIPRPLIPLGTEGYGRSETQGHAARLLRGGCQVRRPRLADCAGPRRQAAGQPARPGHQGARHQSRQAEPADGLTRMDPHYG